MHFPAVLNFLPFDSPSEMFHFLFPVYSHFSCCHFHDALTIFAPPASELLALSPRVDFPISGLLVGIFPPAVSMPAFYYSPLSGMALPVSVSLRIPQCPSLPWLSRQPMTCTELWFLWGRTQPSPGISPSSLMGCILDNICSVSLLVPNTSRPPHVHPTMLVAPVFRIRCISFPAVPMVFD